MKVLLDENLPHQLRVEFPGHDVFTVAFMAWGGLQNGKLLAEAAAKGFDVLLTTDRGLEYQQNANALPLAVVVIVTKTNTIEAIRAILLELTATLAAVKPNAFVRVPTL